MSVNENSLSDPEWKEEKKFKPSREKTVISEYMFKKQQLPNPRFCEKWLNIFNPWLARCADDPNKPFCRACQCRLDCNRCHLQRHERTSKHARNLEILISKGEEAARENYNIRQERNKYYQQRKKMSSVNEGNNQNGISEAEVESTEEYVENTEAEDESYEFEQAGIFNGTNIDTEQQYENVHIKSESDYHHLNKSDIKRNGTTPTKDRIKLLMQIQKDKNDLMNSFKELIGSGTDLLNSPPREKNPVDLFFESVSSSVKALSPKLIAEAKMRVSQLICELELRTLNENDQQVLGPRTILVAPSSSGDTYKLHQTVHDNSPSIHSQSNEVQTQKEYNTVS